MARPAGPASAYARRDPYDPEGVSPTTVSVCVSRFQAEDEQDSDIPEAEPYVPLTPYTETRKRFSRYDGFNPDLHTNTWKRR